MAETLASLEKPQPVTLRTAQLFRASACAPNAEEPLHELRVRIPVALHRQLLSLKILRGMSLAETLSTALDVYFADQDRRLDHSVGET